MEQIESQSSVKDGKKEVTEEDVWRTAGDCHVSSCATSFSDGMITCAN